MIACSTGGPKALGELIPQLPAHLGAGVLIVQHMPAGFTASLAGRLDAASPLSVARGRRRRAPRARHRAAGARADRTCASTLTAAPGCPTTRRWAASSRAPTSRSRTPPSVCGARMVLVVLTGMGRDGLEGAKAVKATGGRVLVEAESTCTVYGMPRAVAEAGLADEVLPLDELADAIVREAGR